MGREDFTVALCDCSSLGGYCLTPFYPISNIYLSLVGNVTENGIKGDSTMEKVGR